MSACLALSVSPPVCLYILSYVCFYLCLCAPVYQIRRPYGPRRAGSWVMGVVVFTGPIDNVFSRRPQGAQDPKCVPPMKGRDPWDGPLVLGRRPSDLQKIDPKWRLRPTNPSTLRANNPSTPLRYRQGPAECAILFSFLLGMSNILTTLAQSYVRPSACSSVFPSVCLFVARSD